MKSVLLDTHTWAWSLTGDNRLSESAIFTLTNAVTVFLSPISFYEIGQKVRIGKWPEMAECVDRLPEILEQQGGSIAALESRICLAASIMDWNHRKLQ
ncbi:MAG: type II toxin-antitoxin system VapC family toxin [Vulcanimicrobiota bacterium]